MWLLSFLAPPGVQSGLRSGGSASQDADGPTEAIGALNVGQTGRERARAAITFLFCAAVLVSYTTLVARYLTPRAAVENLDFWYHIDLGLRLSWLDARTLVDGMYPLGYPFLLRVAIENGADALRFGQFLSWTGGLLALISVFIIILRVARSLTLALAGVLLLVTNMHFLGYAAYEGTDILAAGLQALSVCLMLLFEPDRKPVASRRFAFAGGFVLGLAYLVRYTSLPLLVCFLLYVLVRRGKSFRCALGDAALPVVGFVLAAAPQIVPSIAVYHQPFFSTQAKNVWFGLYGQGDWVTNWGKMPDTISLLQVISLDPGRFVEHWWGQFSSAFASLPLWPPLLHYFWLLGSLALIFDRRLHPAGRLLMVLALLAPIAATSMAWLTPRFLLVSVALQTVAMVLVADRIASLLPVRRAVQTVLVLAAVAAAVGTLQVNSLARWLDSPPRTDPGQVNEFLRIAGMADPRTVATNDAYLHATDVPGRTRYDQVYAVAASPKSVDELLAQPAASNWRYLVLNYGNRFGAFGSYSGIRDAASQAKSRLVPLSLEEAATIFLIKPPILDELTRDDVVLDNGMKLIGHRLQQWKGASSLYLFWQTDKKLDRSYKVSVRTMRRDGTMLFQIDNVPQLWTYPTNRWVPNDTVVDFYYLGANVPCQEDCQLAVVAYDEQTGKPAERQVQAGEKQVGPVVILEQFYR